MDTNSADSLKQLWWEGLPLLIAAPISLFSIHCTNEDLVSFTAFFLSKNTKELKLLVVSRPPSTATQPFWMDKDVFKLIMKQKNKLLWKEKMLSAQKGGSSRRLNHKAAQRDSTTDVPTNVHVCMCLPQQASNPGTNIWFRIEVRIHKDINPSRTRDTLHRHIYFYLTLDDFKVKTTVWISLWQGKQLGNSDTVSIYKKDIAAIISDW